MNSVQIKGNWQQLIGKAKEKWGRLTEDDWKIVEGKRDQLIGKIFRNDMASLAKRLNVSWRI